RDLVAVAGGHGQRHPVDGDRALLDHVPVKAGRQPDRDGLPVLRGLAAQYCADTVDVSLHQVAAEPGGQGGGPFQVDRVALGQRAQRRTVSVSFITSAVNASPSTDTTVRHTPLTAIESPGRASPATSGPVTRSSAASPRSSTAATVPSSSTMPVNITGGPPSVRR